MDSLTLEEEKRNLRKMKLDKHNLTPLRSTETYEDEIRDSRSWIKDTRHSFGKELISKIQVLERKGRSKTYKASPGESTKKTKTGRTKILEAS